MGCSGIKVDCCQFGGFWFYHVLAASCCLVMILLTYSSQSMEQFAALLSMSPRLSESWQVMIESPHYSWPWSVPKVYCHLCPNSTFQIFLSSSLLQLVLRRCLVLPLCAIGSVHPTLAVVFLSEFPSRRRSADQGWRASSAPVLLAKVFLPWEYGLKRASWPHDDPVVGHLGDFHHLSTRPALVGSSPFGP